MLTTQALRTKIITVSQASTHQCLTLGFTWSRKAYYGKPMLIIQIGSVNHPNRRHFINYKYKTSNESMSCIVHRHASYISSVPCKSIGRALGSNEYVVSLRFSVLLSGVSWHKHEVSSAQPLVSFFETAPSSAVTKLLLLTSDSFFANRLICERKFSEYECSFCSPGVRAAKLDRARIGQRRRSISEKPTLERYSPWI